MTSPNSSGSLSIDRLVKIYAYITFIGVTIGVVAAHLPAIIGDSWTSCEGTSSPLTCTLVYHLYEVPIILYLIYVAWYALKRFSQSTMKQFASLVLIGVVANIGFFTFETTLILESLHQHVDFWEPLTITGVAVVLAGGSGFGIYVHQQLIKAANN